MDKFISNDLAIIQMAEDIEAGILDVGIALDVILEKYSSVDMLAKIRDVLDKNGFQSVIDKFIIEKHNRLLKLHEDMEFLERCLILEIN